MVHCTVTWGLNLMHHQTNQLFYTQLKIVSMPRIIQDSIHPLIFCTQESDEVSRNNVECDPNKLSQEFKKCAGVTPPVLLPSFLLRVEFPAWEAGAQTSKLKTSQSLPCFLSSGEWGLPVQLLETGLRYTGTGVHMQGLKEEIRFWSYSPNTHLYFPDICVLQCC